MSKKITDYFRKYLQRFKEYVPGEQPRGDEWLKLNTNENPYEPPVSIVDDIKAGLKNLRKYPDIDAVELKKQIAYNFPVERGLALKMDNIVVGSGEDEILDMLFKTFVDPGDKVVTFNPSYGMYKVFCDIYGGTLVEIPLDSSFDIPADKVMAAEGKIMFICSPNNPTGKRVSNDLIDKTCKSFDGIVVIDEAYCHFAKDTAISLLKDHENLIIMRTFSKAFSLAALRVGFLMTMNRDIVKAVRKVKLPYNVNLAGQVAALSCLKHIEEVNEIIERIKGERDKLWERLNEMPEAKVLPSESNFLLMKVDVGDKARNTKVNLKLYWELKKRKVLVRMYSARNMQEFLRISVGDEMANERLVKEMKECMEIAMQQA
ncbi:MAG: histidinol-phosphate transaminase [Candidatus Hodarchaeota archaeon]